MRGRRGYLLAEALCALALSGLLAAAAATALTGARRAIASADVRSAAVRGGREALLSIGALVRDADLLRIEGDTALAFSVRIGASVICSSDPRSLTLPPVEVAAGSPLTLRAQPIEAGDEIAILVRDSIFDPPVWWRARVDSVQSRTAAEPCGAAGGWVAPEDAGRPRLRLVIAPSPPPGLLDGSPVRLSRPGRLSLYASGGGEWMLGWRRCAGTPRICGVIQPVAGPLRSPGAGGLRLRFDAAAGGLLVEVRVPGEAQPLRAAVALRDAPS